MPSTVAEVEEVREQRAELVPRPVRLGGDPPAVAELRALVEAEDGLRVADVDREQHRGGTLLVFGAERLADALGERLGGQLRLVALAAQLLDRDVARREDLGPRDDPRRPVLVPDPDVLELELEKREPARRRSVPPAARRACCRGTSRPASARRSGRARRRPGTPSSAQARARPRTRRDRRGATCRVSVAR